MKAFFAPKTTLGSLDAEAASALIEKVVDVALIIDQHGIIRDRAFHTEELAAELENNQDWIGRRWLDTVTIESHPKVTALLKDPADANSSRPRHINHPASAGADVPILYTATRIGRTRNVLACGRDLRIISTLQRRLLDAQQYMERDHTRMRQVETRYRLLFQVSPDPVLIVDALTQRMVEANQAATRMLEVRGMKLNMRSVTEIFTAESQLAIQALLAGMRVSARGEEVRAQLADHGGEVRVSAALFRQEEANFFLLRLTPSGDAPGVGAASSPRAMYPQLIEKSPDGIVITSGAGVVVAANPAFLEMAELATEGQARGERLDRWLGRPGVDTDILLGNLRQRDSVRLYATRLRGEFGAELDVELSATAFGTGEQPLFGFFIRDSGRRLGSDNRRAGNESKPVLELPRSVEQLTELIGRVPLKELVRESTDMIERLCIEAALEVTSDNRASAAEMLGLSRQSLYVKLRRYGLGDLDEGDKP